MAWLRKIELADGAGIRFNSIYFSKKFLKSKICYVVLGCFSGVFLPHAPEYIGTTLRLYTRKNPKSAQILQYDNDETIKDSNFNSTLKTIFITHGWTGSWLVSSTF